MQSLLSGWRNGLIRVLAPSVFDSDACPWQTVRVVAVRGKQTQIYLVSACLSGDYGFGRKDP